MCARACVTVCVCLCVCVFALGIIKMLCLTVVYDLCFRNVWLSSSSFFLSFFFFFFSFLVLLRSFCIVYLRVFGNVSVNFWWPIVVILCCFLRAFVSALASSEEWSTCWFTWSVYDIFLQQTPSIGLLHLSPTNTNHRFTTSFLQQTLSIGLRHPSFSHCRNLLRHRSENCLLTVFHWCSNK